jgi:CubicO group peptidase (beta-lactamase class C family)
MLDLDTLACDTGFSGVVRIDRTGELPLERAYGFAHRALEIPNTVTTRFAMASGSKTFTALAVLALVEDGALELSTPARTLLSGDLPLVDDRVTIEHLLSHRSGIGDYIDEEAIDDLDEFYLPVPVGRLAEVESYLPLLEGNPQLSEPGARFAYNNAGFVLLSIIAERAGGVPFHTLVEERVLLRAGLQSTAYLRSDELPADAALGYLRDGLRTNVLHLPVRGGGDGGAYTTIADVRRFWTALFEGLIVSRATVEAVMRPRSEVSEQGFAYGLGLWLRPERGTALLEGADVGVSFRSEHDPASGRTWTVASNTGDGAWPIARALAL